MVQRAVRAGGAPPSADRPHAGGAEGLGRDWIVLRGCRLGRPARGGHPPTVLMHPARGIAVLDVLPADTRGAAEALRARLHAARFPAIFAGHLPVVHLQVAPHRVPSLSSLLDEAFAAQPPLDLPGGDAWVGVAARALTAEQPVPRLEAPRRPGGEAGQDRQGRRARRRAAPLRAAAALLLCAAALGGVLGFALNRAPAPEAAPVAAVVDPSASGETASRAPAPPLVPDPVPTAPPPSAPATQREAATTATPVPDTLPPASPVPSVVVPPPPPSPPPPRRPEAGAPLAPPPAGKRPERSAPRRRQPDAGPARPAAGGADDPAAPRPLETPPDRCGRVSAQVGSGAPLAEADMRFFNENCIRW